MHIIGINCKWLQDNLSYRREESVLVKENQIKKYSHWKDKNLSIYKDKEKNEYEIGIIGTFKNESNIIVKIALEVKGYWFFLRYAQK